MKYQRERDIEEFYRLIWSSLETHLDGMYLKTPEGRNFHKKTVKEYVRMMELLKRLT